MNRAEYIAFVRGQLGQFVEDKLLQDKEIELHIKNARIYIVKRLWRICQDKFYDTENYAITLSLTDEFYEDDLPSDYLEDVNVVNNGYTARRVNYSDTTAVDDNTYMASSVSSPIYYIRGSKLGLRPSTNGTTATLYFLATPTAFSDDTTDESGLAIGIPAEYQELVAYKACGPLRNRFKIDTDFDTLVEAKIDTLLKKKVSDVMPGQGVPK